MLEYKWGNFQLIHAPKRTKIAYTALLVYLMLGLVTIVAMELIKTGWNPQGVLDYYRGNEEKFMFEKSPLEMLEVTHMHLFSVPVVFFILGHAFLMTTLSEKLRYGILAASIVSVFGSIGTPWLVRFFPWPLGWLKVLSDGVLAATLLIMTLYPIYEMWFKTPPKTRSNQRRRNYRPRNRSNTQQQNKAQKQQGEGDQGNRQQSNRRNNQNRNRNRNRNRNQQQYRQQPKPRRYHPDNE